MCVKIARGCTEHIAALKSHLSNVSEIENVEGTKV